MANAAPAPALLQISISAIVENHRLVRALSKARTAAVIKADGYGCGAVPVFTALYADNVRQFFVATPNEGAAIRALADDTEIFILGGAYLGDESFYADQNLIPVLNSLGDIERWTDVCSAVGRRLPAALHFDTGMNRLGLGHDETEKLIADRGLLSRFTPRLVMSHFSCSDEKDHPMNEDQARRFARIAAAFPVIEKSLCNSSGVFRDAQWHYDLLRPGFCLYGGNPMPETINPMRRVVDLSVRILQTRRVKAGENAGYAAGHTFRNDTTIATVAVGYADGIIRSGSGKAKLYWNGQACPVVGRISMDTIIVDTGAITGQKPQTGDMLEMLGPHQSVDDLAADCGTIGYEILTSLGKRYERRYI